MNGGSIAALATGAAAVYGGLITLFFACMMDFDSSEVVGPGQRPVETGVLLLLTATLTPGGVFTSLQWRF